MPIAEKATPEAKAQKFVEVQLKRKYAPLYCYEVIDDRAELVLHPETGLPVRQVDQVVGQKMNIFNEKKDVLKEILETIPPGVKIDLPGTEAARLIAAHVADPTSNTFRGL